MTRSAAIVVLSAFAAACGSNAKRVAGDSTRSCLHYGPETVTVRGHLERLVFPGIPNFEDTLQGDEPEAGFYLQVTPPICVAGGRDQELGEPHFGVDSVQLVLDSIGYATLRPQLGRVIAVRGALFPEHTGHHHAPVLLDLAKPIRSSPAIR